MSLYDNLEQTELGMQEDRIGLVVKTCCILALPCLAIVTAVLMAKGDTAVLINFIPYYLAFGGCYLAIRFGVLPSKVGLAMSLSIASANIFDRLSGDPDVIMPFAFFVVISNLYFQVNRARTAAMVSTYHFAGIVVGTFIVEYWQPFEIIYTNQSTETAMYALLVTSPIALIAIYWTNVSQLEYLIGLLNQKNQIVRSQSNSYRNLLGVIVHDVAGVATRVDSRMQMLNKSLQKIDGVQENEKLRKKLASLEETVENLSEVIRNTQKMGFSRDYAEKESSAIPIDFYTILKKAQLVNQEEINAKEINIDFPSHEKKSVVVVDPVTFSFHVFNNFFYNAIKFSDAQGTIKVGVEHLPNQRMVLSITNRAKGVDPVKLKTALSGDGPVKSKRGTKGEKGQGLGLQIAMHFCKQDGYNVSHYITKVDDEYDDVTVTIEVPEQEPDSASLAA